MLKKRKLDTFQESSIVNNDGLVGNPEQNSYFYYDQESTAFKFYFKKYYIGKIKNMPSHQNRKRISSIDNKSYNEYTIPGDGACMLYALGINPKQCFIDLIANKDHPIIKKILLREMQACFSDPADLGRRFESIDNDYVNISKKYFEARKNPFLAKSIIEDFCTKHLENYLDKYKAKIQSSDKLWYLRVPVNGQASFQTLIEAVAILYNFNIEIYQRIDINDEKNIELRWRFFSRHKPMCRIIYVGQDEFNHFNLLVPLNEEVNNRIAFCQEMLFKFNINAPVQKKLINIMPISMADIVSHNNSNQTSNMVVDPDCYEFSANGSIFPQATESASSIPSTISDSLDKTIKISGGDEIIISDNKIEKKAELKRLFIDEQEALNCLNKELSIPQIKKSNNKIDDYLSDYTYQKIDFFMEFIGFNGFFDTDDYSVNLDMIMFRFKQWMEVFFIRQKEPVYLCMIKKIVDFQFKIIQNFPKEIPRELHLSLQEGELKTVRQLQELSVDIPKTFLDRVFIDLCSGNNFTLWKQEKARRNEIIKFNKTSSETSKKIAIINCHTNVPNFFKETKNQMQKTKEGFVSNPNNRVC